MEDSKIIALVFARSEQAITELSAKYGKLCLHIANNILGNNQDAEECVNDAYIGVWNAIPPTRPQHLMSFLCKITRNLSLKRLEAMTRKKRSATVVSLEELAEILPDESIANGVSDGEIAKAINRFLHNESATVRNVFLRKYYFFDSIGDIAQRFGFTESKVKSMLFHTRKKLKEYLIKEGVEL